MRPVRRKNSIQSQNQQLGQRADSPDSTDGALKSVHVSLRRERVEVGWRVPPVPTGLGAGDSGLAPASARVEGQESPTAMGQVRSALLGSCRSPKFHPLETN